MSTEDVQLEIKKIIIDRLDLEDVTINDIETEMALFDDGKGGDSLGLDSVESLDLIIGLEQTYGIKIGEGAEIRDHFYSVKTIADYVQELTAKKTASAA